MKRYKIVGGKLVDVDSGCFCGELASVDRPCSVCQPVTRDDCMITRAQATPISAKVAYVKTQGQSRSHGCHWLGCNKQVPPAMWSCRTHWYALPKFLRDKIWRAYEIGQEVTMTPSREYLDLMDEVQRWIVEHG